MNTGNLPEKGFSHLKFSLTTQPKFSKLVFPPCSNPKDSDLFCIPTCYGE